MPVLDLATSPRPGHLTNAIAAALEAANRRYYGYCPVDSWAPSVNLYETAGSYRVCVDLAGVDKERINLTVQQQRLRIQGTRQIPTAPLPLEGEAPADRSIRVHLMEIDHGPFCRDVELPTDVDQARITATHRNGLLWIELPKI